MDPSDTAVCITSLIDFYNIVIVTSEPWGREKKWQLVMDGGRSASASALCSCVLLMQLFLIRWKGKLAGFLYET